MNENEQSSTKHPRFKKVLWVIGMTPMFIIVLILAALLSLNSFYTLKENEVAVLKTLGRPESVTDAGIHFKIPFIQNVHKMSREILGMRIGYDDTDQTVPSESEMITVDANFVNVDFWIEYQVTDPLQAYINRDTAETILRNLAQSYIRDTVGVYGIDEVLTTGKSEIQSRIKTLLSERMLEENVGLGIVNVTIQDSEPPTDEISKAFEAVEDAKQGMDTKINEAKKYESTEIPNANARADKIVQEAEAYRQERISEAEGQAARFNELYEEYVKYPLITKKRMYYEALEEVLPSLKVYIDGSGDGKTQTMLPLEPFAVQSQTSEPASSGISQTLPDSGSGTAGETAEPAE